MRHVRRKIPDEVEGEPVTTISVIIPAYNSAAFIRRTVQSALDLSETDVEIIVVDDGSTDSTSDIVSQIQGVTLISQANAGDSAARNSGLERARGEFVIFLDHDDLLLPEAASHHLRAFGENGSVDLVFGSNHLIDEAGQIIGLNRQQSRSFESRDVALGTTPSFSQCMYRRSALDRIGGFRREAGMAADHDLNLRLLGRSGRGFIHDEFVMQYRLHAGQQTKSPARLYRVHMQALRHLLARGGELEDPTLLREAEAYWQRYYGKFLPAEVWRMLRSVNISRAAGAAGLFARIAPRAMPSAGRYWIKRLRGEARSR